MAAMVSSEKRTRCKVWPYMRSILPNGIPIKKPAIIAATRMPVPVADAQFSVKTAFSGLASAGTTGGTRTICSCSPAIGNFGDGDAVQEVLELRQAPKNTSTLRITNGIHALRTSAGLWRLRVLMRSASAALTDLALARDRGPDLLSDARP